MSLLPSIKELFELYEGDSFWNELSRSCCLIMNTGNDLLKEMDSSLGEVALDNFSNIKFHLHKYIYRSLRIYHSIVILSLFRQGYEASMLCRPLYENIAETRHLLKSKRAKAINKLLLYELVNEIIRYSRTYLKDYEQSKNRFGSIITTKLIEECAEGLRNKIREGLSKYEPVEIEKMRKKIEKGLSWHGRHIKSLFKDYDMNSLAEDYDMACKLVHVREENPYLHDDTIILPHLYEASVLLLDHIINFENLCKRTITAELKDNILNKKKELQKMMMMHSKEHFQGIDEFIRE